MGRLIPKKNPSYDPLLDLNLLVRCGPEELFERMWREVHPTNVTLEERDDHGFAWSSVSAVGMKNLWARARFEREPAGLRVTTKITKAHTWGWFKILEIQVGPQTVRGINAYNELIAAWKLALTEVIIADGRAATPPPPPFPTTTPSAPPPPPPPPPPTPR